MPPLPGVLAMLAPSQHSPKSLSSTASTTITTEVAGSGFISDMTTSVTTSTAITTTTATTATATKKCSSSVATTTISTSSVKTTDSAKKASPSSSDSKSSTASCSNASSSSKVEDAVTDVNKKCDNNDSEKTESSNDDTDLDTSSNIFGRPQKILLKHVNAHITCNLCTGYLIDATTIVECLHSFCHSCIMNHLRKDRKDQYCPRCEMMINTAKPNNIKSDTTLQAIVYKLVPGLYEKELLRKRAFYCTRPKEAMLATPEQRGEDTEHLIFGPTENMSLSLEYADIDEIPTSDTFELNKPKYLQCPAIFTVNHIKKFVFGKFGIDQNRFTIEIMYKVKTIVLADHYKIMDVAYIYTWKRDAPMRFFFRVKEMETSLRKKKEMKMLRSKEDSSAIRNESDTGTKDETKIEVKGEVKEGTGVKKEEAPAPFDAVQNVSLKDEVKSETEKQKSITDTQQTKLSSDKPSPDPRTEKLKITLINKGKSSSKDDESSKSKSNSKTGKASKHHTPTEQDDRKVENIKLKIDLSKQGSVTIINMSSPDANKKEVKLIKPEKEWKIKVKKDKDLKTGGSTEKTKSSSEEKLVPPITIELDKPSSSPKSPEMSISEKEEEEKKSEFLNSIALAPIKSLHSPDKLEKQKFVSSLSATLPPSNFSTKKFSMAPPPAPPAPKLSAAAKRKNKEPVKNVAKKPKLELPKPTPPQHPQIKVRSNLLADPKPDASNLSFKLAPFPIGATSAPSIPMEISKKQEDEKLMPAPPPLKLLEIFKKNGLKAPKLSKTKPPNKPVKTTSEGFLRPMVTTSLTSSKVPIVSNVMGNRTPIARRYPPILPKSSRINPFANIPTDINKFLPGPTTEIKPIQNGENKEIKVYGPPTTTSSNQKPNIPSPSTSACTSTPSTQQQNGSTTPRHSTKNSTSTNYLNYAIYNASKTKMSDVPLGCRTPIYTPNSPIYSPNSPQYMPNYNIPIQPTYKYTKTQTNVGSYLQNVFGPNKQMSNLFPAPPTKTPSESQSANNNNKSDGDENSLKRTKSPSTFEKNSPEPTDKQTPVQSLLNSCNINIPSSLSITITNENSDSNSNNSNNPKHNNPVNNYIEILKLPDSPSVTSEHSNSISSSPDHNKNSNQSSKQNNSKAGFTVNLPKSSPSGVSTPTQHTKPPPSPNPSTTTHCVPTAPDSIDKKPSTPLPQKAKKTPSPEKKIVEKPLKKAQAEKRPAPDSTKTSKDKTEISPTPTKKYRPILPRAKTPPIIAAAPTVTTPSPKTNPKLTAQSTNTKKASQKPITPTTNNKSPMPSPSSSNLTKKPESVVDLTTAQKTSPPSTSPVPSNSVAQTMSTPNMQPDLSPFLQQLQQAQSPGSPNGNIFLPHLAAAASFNPTGYPAVTFGYNLQRAYLMEQLTRMQKAGTEALEKYMQRLKNNNTSLAKSPTGSPGSTTPTDSGSDVKNSV